MSAVLEVVSPGAMASIQDLGRPGLRRVGVPHAGALEPGWLRLANALLGNAEDAPAIEFLAGGLVLRARELPVQIALAGHFSAALTGAGGQRQVGARHYSPVVSPALVGSANGAISRARNQYDRRNLGRSNDHRSAHLEL